MRARDCDVYRERWTDGDVVGGGGDFTLVAREHRAGLWVWVWVWVCRSFVCARYVASEIQTSISKRIIKESLVCL